MSQKLNEEGVLKMEETFRKTGLPDDLLPAIRKEMDERREQFFVFPHETELNGKFVYVELAFYWRQKEDSHRLMSMGVSLQNDPENRLNTNIFPLLSHSEVTVQEAVNLMQGRSVYRMLGYAGQGSYWLTLDTEKQYEGMAALELRKSGINLGQAINELSLPVALTSAQKMEIARVLQAGDRYVLNFPLDRKPRQVLLQAEPEMDRVSVLNKKGERIEWRDFEKEMAKEQGPTLPGHRRHL